MNDEADTDVRATLAPDDQVKAIAAVGLQVLDTLVIIASLSYSDEFQGLVEDICDSLKPMLKWAARYGNWQG